jgi:hypothetical protein
MQHSATFAGSLTRHLGRLGGISLQLCFQTAVKHFRGCMRCDLGKLQCMVGAVFIVEVHLDIHVVMIFGWSLDMHYLLPDAIYVS